MTALAINLLSDALYGDEARERYRWMRQHAPVYRDEGNGLWGIATHAGVVAAGRDTATFSNAGGSRPDTGPLPWMIDLDGSDHMKRRKLVSGGFTPTRVRSSEDRVIAICDQLIDAVCEQGECDLVHDLAAPLPMTVIGDMLGVAPEDRPLLAGWTNDLLASLSGSPEHIEAAAGAFVGYTEYATGMLASRRAQPTDDLFSVLVQAEVDGDRLEDHELVFESLLLLVGGHETTRHVTTGGVEQLLRHPDQRQHLTDDPTAIPAAVEEMLRWVSPIKSMNRTVTSDIEMGGQLLRAGQKALLLYESANFDEVRFDHPERFDVTRAPNDHVAFGFGPHFCLGASLARLEVRAMVGRLLQRLPDLELASTEPLPRFLGAIQSMPVRFTPTAPLAGRP